MKAEKRRVCVYCDERDADTRDHVIAKCLFPKPRPSNLITVPSCDDCNSDKAIDDDFLRDYLTVDFAGSQSPTASALFEGKVRRSVKRNSSDLARSLLESARDQPLYTKGGIYLGDAVFAPIDESRFIKLFGRIIRGLYFHYTRKIIPLSYPVEVGRVMPWDFESVWDSFSNLKFSACGPLADVFVGGCARVKEDPLSTWWLMTFYGRVHFSIGSVNPDLGRSLREPAA